MADEVIEQASAAPAAQETSTQASPPSPASDAATGANTAPASKDVAREAFNRLAKGETPDAVNRELYSKKPSVTSATVDAKAGSQANRGNGGEQAGRAKDGQPSQQQAVQPGEEGITPEDLQVLKRAKFDLGAWKHIPPSNRKAIVANFKASQAEADRTFQQARGQGNPAAGQPATQTQTTSQDQATQPGAQQSEGQPANQQGNAQQRTQAATQQQAAVPGFELLNGIDPNSLVDPADLETLRTLGGDELAETHRRGVARAVGLVQQQLAPMQHVLAAMVNNWETSEFRSSIDDLRKQPGFDQLTPEQETQIKAKADLLIRAANDIQNYRYREAVSDAAASLFRTNVQRSAQQQLLQARKASLDGSPERGVGRAAETRTLSPTERNRAIFDKLKEGLDPTAARLAVDGR